MARVVAARWEILIQWNWITKPATELFPPAMRGSTGACLSPSTPRGSTADPSVRRERQNGRTLRSIPQRAQRRRLVSGLVFDAAPKVPQIWPPGEAHRTDRK